MVCVSCRGEWAVEDDVLPCVAPGNDVWVWGLGGVTRTFHGIVGARPETVGVVGVEAMGDGEVEDGGADEMVSMGDG
jgi:hypothetical protein